MEDISRYHHSPLKIEGAVHLEESEGHPWNDNPSESRLHAKHYEIITADPGPDGEQRNAAVWSDEDGQLWAAPAKASVLEELQRNDFVHGEIAKYPPQHPLGT